MCFYLFSFKTLFFHILCAQNPFFLSCVLIQVITYINHHHQEEVQKGASLTKRISLQQDYKSSTPPPLQWIPRVSGRRVIGLDLNKLKTYKEDQTGCKVYLIPVSVYKHYSLPIQVVHILLSQNIQFEVSFIDQTSSNNDYMFNFYK